MMTECRVRQADDPACQRRFGEIAEIECLAPQPVLRLVNAKLQRAGQNGKAAQTGDGKQYEKDLTPRFRSDILEDEQQPEMRDLTRPTKR